MSLINEANPGLMELRDLVNSRFGPATVYATQAGEIADTSLEIYAQPGSFYLGKRIVYYRRQDMAKLFANMILDVDEWQASGTCTLPNYVRLLNAKYGLALIDSDLAPHGTAGNGVTYTLTINNTSLAYKGSFRFRWSQGKRELRQILTLDSYAGLYWDANYIAGKPLMNLVGMAIDFTRFTGAKAIATGSTITVSSGDVRTMAEWFGEYTGQTLDIFKDHTVQGGIQGLTITRFTLPNANVPEANSDKFNRCLVISPKTDSWFAGKIIWHYNE